MVKSVFIIFLGLICTSCTGTMFIGRNYGDIVNMPSKIESVEIHIDAPTYVFYQENVIDLKLESCNSILLKLNEYADTIAFYKSQWEEDKRTKLLHSDEFVELGKSILELKKSVEEKLSVVEDIESNWLDEKWPDDIKLNQWYENGRKAYQRNYYIEARSWFEKASNHDHGVSHFRFGEMLYMGEGGDQDISGAALCYIKAANKEVPNAQYNLALLYKSGKGVERNLQKYFYWLDRACKNGFEKACSDIELDNEPKRICFDDLAFLNNTYNVGSGFTLISGDEEKSYRMRASEGDISAQKALAYYYSNHDTYYPLAAEWYKKAVNLGDIEAQSLLGVAYSLGYCSGRKINEELAMQWFSISAENGNPIGQLNLALRYWEGEIVEKDLKLAKYWLDKSSASGCHYSFKYLGYMYYLGAGVQPNDSLAFYWIKRSAEAGDSDGQYNLGYLYDYGIGTEEDDTMAAKWYEKSAKCNNYLGQFNLGIIYKKGIGRTKSLSLAKYYLEKSCNEGHFNFICDELDDL